MKENFDRITEAARKKEVTPSELLKDRMLDITNPNYDIFIRIFSIVIDEAQSDKDTIERSVARSFLRRARSLNHT